MKVVKFVKIGVALQAVGSMVLVLLQQCSRTFSMKISMRMTLEENRLLNVVD